MKQIAAYAFIDSQNLNLGTSKDIRKRGKVIVSGDGDFYCLHEYLKKQKKLLSIIIPNEKSESSLLRAFQKYKTFLIFDKEKLKK